MQNYHDDDYYEHMRCHLRDANFPNTTEIHLVCGIVVITISCTYLTKLKYFCRLHIIGLLLVAILDSGDVFVDIAKIAVYFKDSGRNSKAKIIADVFFLLFTIHL